MNMNPNRYGFTENEHACQVISMFVVLHHSVGICWDYLSCCSWFKKVRALSSRPCCYDRRIRRSSTNQTCKPPFKKNLTKKNHQSKKKKTRQKTKHSEAQHLRIVRFKQVMKAILTGEPHCIDPSCLLLDESAVNTIDARIEVPTRCFGWMTCFLKDEHMMFCFYEFCLHVLLTVLF